MKTIDVVCPVFREEEAISLFHNRLVAVLDSHRRHYRFCIRYVVDPSGDRTEAILKAIANGDETVELLVMSRRFGHQAALAGARRREAFFSNTRSTITAVRMTPPATTFCQSDLPTRFTALNVICMMPAPMRTPNTEPLKAHPLPFPYRPPARSLRSRCAYCSPPSARPSTAPPAGGRRMSSPCGVGAIGADDLLGPRRSAGREAHLNVLAYRNGPEAGVGAHDHAEALT